MDTEHAKVGIKQAFSMMIMTPVLIYLSSALDLGLQTSSHASTIWIQENQFLCNTFKTKVLQL